MKPRLAFVCLGNSCRSIMAEAMARHFYGGQVEAVSAGLRPLGWVAPETLAVLTEWQIPTRGLSSKGLAAVALEACQAIINFSGRDLQNHLPPDFCGRILHRQVADPFGLDLDHYRQTRDVIRALLAAEMTSWLADCEQIS
ncbi:MAG: arsenate-mycothiol transferase ArsC [Desulfobacca sp.]|uniref:arsenate-mycothiol transferase ArsC n=1 Tax=Desulfobacca sp. TaxID=2067990 RepID=UPI00404B6890